MVESQDGHYSTTVIRRAQKGRLAALRDEPSKVFAIFEQDFAPLRGSVTHMLGSDMEAESDMDDDVSSALLSPSGQSDAQTLALMLQEQLDAINEEIRMIQVERESTELRSDEIESRVNSGSMDGLNVTLRPRAMPTSATAQSLASSTSPPTTKRPEETPPESSRDLRWRVREDKATIKCETSPPSSPRSMRLETNFAQLTGSLEDGRGHELLEDARRRGLPFAQWDGPTVVSWLELWVGMPAWYVAACRANSSGNVWLTHEEMENLASSTKAESEEGSWAQVRASVTHSSPPPPPPPPPPPCSLTHTLMLCLGLPQYRSYFMECLVDARMLDHLTKKDLRSHLKMVDSFHRASLQYGIMCLKRLNYDRKDLERRREDSQHDMKDMLVWTNEQVIHWVQSIGLREYSGNLLESGVHGALARQVLEREFNNVLALGTDRRLEECGDDKTFRRSPSWRKRFRAREGAGGMGMMAGSMETLPAGFRMPSMSMPPSMLLVNKKQHQPEAPPPAPPRLDPSTVRTYSC
ncbi:hypothetical protein CRUP_021596 [Coryphaenoides rupestris]|nr:hypothetical protein CRUP_021596 [Coryphaenoides rupestris]